jgi:hypothetical protein
MMATSRQDRPAGTARPLPEGNRRYPTTGPRGLGGENESFWDAMDQGRAAKSKLCRDMIAATLKTGDAK